MVLDLAPSGYKWLLGRSKQEPDSEKEAEEERTEDAEAPDKINWQALATLQTERKRCVSSWECRHFFRSENTYLTRSKYVLSFVRSGRAPTIHDESFSPR